MQGLGLGLGLGLYFKTFEDDDVVPKNCLHNICLSIVRVIRIQYTYS